VDSDREERDCRLTAKVRVLRITVCLLAIAGEALVLARIDLSHDEPFGELGGGSRKG
jgi:hypothetical protein